MKFSDFIDKILSIFKILIPIIFILTVIVFMWGIIVYISNSGDEKKRKEGADFMIYGIIGITVMVSVWGLVQLISNSLFGTNALLPLF